MTISLLFIKLYIGITIYTFLCLLTSRLGRKTILGFWGMLFMSILLTPIITGIALSILKPWKEEQNNEGHIENQ